MVTLSERWLFSRSAFPLLLLFLAYIQTVSSVQLNVTDENNKTCILVDLAVNFSVTYDDTGKKSRTVQLELPENASRLNNSSCGKENGSAPLLAIGFGEGHMMSMKFAKNATKYLVDELNFSYNLSDSTFFPNASEREQKTVVSNMTGIEADVNTTYRCNNPNNIRMGDVNATFHNIRIEAYLSTNNFSVKETLCNEDVSPTVLPTTIPVPTAVPSVPKAGRYQVNGTNGTCILTTMGLQLNITYLSKINETKVQLLFSIEPHNVTVSGNCSATSPILTLSFEKTLLSFKFGKNDSTNKFYLGGVDVQTTLPSDAKVSPYKATNNSIMYLQTTLGKSYMCKTKQVLNITETFSINAFSLQVQAFKVDGDNFGTAEECQLDEDSILVPIIVGAALAGLVLIVLIAYLIGRKRSHAGYQTI